MSSSANISAQEADILLAVINNTLNVDWVNVAAVTGLKNGNIASTRFSQIKKKLCLTGNNATPGAGGSGNRVTKSGTPAKPHVSSRGRKDTPTKGATPTRARKIKAAAKSYKLDTIVEEDEEDEEAAADYEDGHKKAKGQADTKACDFMAASDNEDAEGELSMIEQVALGYFAQDDDEMGSDGNVIQEEFPRTVAAGIARNAHGGSLFAGSIIAEYDEYAKDAIYEDGETTALQRILYT